jgi:hypothetical protein
VFRFERAALREIREQRNTSGRKAKHKITLNLTKFHSKTALLWRFKIAGKNNKTYTGLRVKFPIFLPDFNINEGFSTDFYKRTPPPHTKLHANPSIGSSADTPEYMDRERDEYDEVYRQLSRLCEYT